MARILIVDDEAPLRDSLSYALAKQGHTVQTADNGAKGLKLATSERFDAVVLDVMLPALDGMGVCREIRRFSEVPIVFLTARDSHAEAIEGLNCGADDYVSKPFNTRELLARIAAVLRRREPAERLLAEDRELVTRVEEILHRKSVKTEVSKSSVPPKPPVEFDPVSKRALFLGMPLELCPEELKLLSILVSNANRVVTRTELIGRLWGPVNPERLDRLEQHVRSLRTKIEPKPSEPRYLRTLPGIGFEFSDGGG